MAVRMGTPLMPWQRLVVDVALEVQSEAAGDPEPGAWAYSDVTVTGPRQKGKTYLLRPVIAHRLGSGNMRRVWSTAQTRIHARRRWMDATDALLHTPLARDLRRKTGVGYEELRWKDTGSTLEPFAPNEDSLHGETPDLVIVDELWAFDEETGEAVRGAYVPGFTTKDAQQWKLSTSGTEESAWFLQSQARGRAAVERGDQLGVCYFEWSLPDVIDGVPVEELDDEALLEAVLEMHPARGYTLRPQSVREAQGDLSRREFMRAYGNRTMPKLRPRVVPLDLVVAGRSVAAPGERFGLAVEVDPDSREASVVAAGRVAGVAQVEGERPVVDGSVVTEVLRTAAGSRWVVEALVEICRRHRPAVVAFNDAGPTREIADAFEARLAIEDDLNVEILRVNARDYAAACVRVREELKAGTWRHRGEESLEDALGVTGLRRVGGVPVWAVDDDPISALVAATVAVWAVDHAPQPEPERFWMG